MAATVQAIKAKAEMAVPDPVLRKRLKAAITRFGVDHVAEAFGARIMRIPRARV